MNKSELEKLSKSQLIALLLQQNVTQPIPAPRTKRLPSVRPIPTPRKSVKQVVQEYDENIILPPPQFRDDYKPIPAPRTKKLTQEKPVPTA